MRTEAHKSLCKASARPPRGQTALERARRAFTLLEIVLALAVTSILLSGASFFLYSLSNIWLRAETTPEVEEHYLGVTSFLNYALTQAETASVSASTAAGGASSGGAAASSAGAAQKLGNITWGYPPNEGTSGTPSIQFSLSEDLPIFVWEEGPLPALTAWLWLDEKEGLYLVWKPQKESQEYPADLYRTLISPLITRISYLYYDDASQRWEEDDKPPSEALASGTVKCICFTFNLGGEERVYKLYFRKQGSSSPLVY